MASTWKVLRIALTWILAVILILTLIFIADRYIFRPNLKGISIVDIRGIIIFVVAPLIVLIVVLRSIEKIKKEGIPKSKD